MAVPHKDTRIRQVEAWRKRHWKSFYFSYRRAPYFPHFEDELRAFFEREYTVLAEITCASAVLTHRMFGLSSKVLRASELPGAPSTIESIRACLPEGTLVVPRAALDADVDGATGGQVLDFATPTYHQSFEGFDPDATALDLLFNYGPESLSVLQSGITVTDIEAMPPVQRA